MAKILIVDDERQILQLLKTVLTRAGFEVHTAATAHEALGMCNVSTAFDLVLSDVEISGMDGHDLARWIAARNLGIRVMLMSAYEHECEHCPFSPRCELIPKPFVPREVTKRIAAALAGTGGMA